MLRPAVALCCALFLPASAAAEAPLHDVDARITTAGDRGSHLGGAPTRVLPTPLPPSATLHVHGKTGTASAAPDGAGLTHPDRGEARRRSAVQRPLDGVAAFDTAAIVDVVSFPEREVPWSVMPSLRAGRFAAAGPVWAFGDALLTVDPEAVR